MLKGKVVLVTGGAGSIGSELVEQVLRQKPAQVRVFSRDEGKHHALLQKLGHPQNLRFLIGDVRDRDRLNFAFRGVQTIFHVAALKHVPSCEYNPFEVFRTNVMGSQNVVDAAIWNSVERVVAVSTDKVVDPVSVMGTSKLMMEKLIINANYYKGVTPIKFSCVRFGNVAWASGSVLPLWKAQVEKQGVITVTNTNMTRFMMSVDEAVELVIKAGKLMQGGEIFILKMSAITLASLADEFIAKYYPHKKIKIRLIGNRVGEKLHEGLLGAGDANVLENEKMFVSIPHIWEYTGRRMIKPSYPGFKKRMQMDPYLSSEHVDVERIRKII